MGESLRYTSIMTLTRFGFNIPSFTYPGVDDSDLFDAVCAAASTAENSGFDSLWVMDHFHQIPPMGSADEPMLEPYTVLAALTPADVRHKLDVLEAHCEQADRDPSDISKTRLGALVMADTAADADRLGAELRSRRNMSMDKYRGYAIEGDREGVCDQVAALFDAGLDGLIFNMHDATDLGAIAEAGTVLRDNFGDHPSR